MSIRLQNGQKTALLEWVAEGLLIGEINERAAAYDPPFRVTRSLVDYYRKTRKVQMGEITQAAELDALTTGLAIRSVRVGKLQLLAALMEEDLFAGVMWVEDVKMVGQGRTAKEVWIERFNESEVRQYLATLDQIASEVGDKKPEGVIPSEIQVTFARPPEKGGR
jgi:hypothetical protein